MNANDDAPLGGDLVFEGKAIAEYWGLSERKCRYLMASGQLPGAFQIGGRWFLSKSAALEAIREKARGGEATARRRRGERWAQQKTRRAG